MVSDMVGFHLLGGFVRYRLHSLRLRLSKEKKSHFEIIIEGVGHIRILGTGLELACNGGS